MRCSQPTDCPGTSQCVDGYCISEVELGDTSNPAVASIQLTPESADLSVGEVLELSTSTLDEQGEPVASAELRWESTDETIATVDEAGVVTAESVGTAVITASANGSLDSTKINVAAVPADAITVEPSSLQLKPGERSTLAARVLDEAGEELGGAEIRWSSDNPAIAFVDGSGQVTAANPGSTTVTATTATPGSANIEQSVTVEVLEAELVTVELMPTAVELTEGDDFELLALVRDEFGELAEDAPVDWTSSDDAIATVSDVGVVSAVAPGSATITAESGSGQATADITVVPTAVATIELTPISASIETGATLALDARALAADSTELSWPTITFTSSNDNTASVDATGTVSAHQPGTVAITAAAGGVERSAAITVTSTQAAGLSVSPTVADIEVGLSVVLTATVVDVNGNTVSNPFVVWESSDTAVAMVDAGGEVFGVGIGTATITARTDNGTQASATITVAERSAATIDLRPQSATIEETQTLELTATVRDSDQTILENRAITFDSSADTIAAVDSNGVVTGLAPGGPVTITATSGGASQTVAITVAQRSVASVDVNPQLETVQAADTVTLSATPRAADGSSLLGRTISWTSDDGTIASVASGGVVTGEAEGITLIRATVEGKVGFASVNVTPRPVASVEILEGDQSLSKGSSVQLSTTTRDSGGGLLTGRDVSWSSNDTGVAIADASGEVFAVAGGQAVITATSEGVTDTINVTVSSNAAPTATAQSVSTDEDTQASITLSGTDPENDTLTYSIATLPANGTLSGLNASSGDVTYTPDADYNGSDSFTFSVTDTAGATGTATVSLTIAAVNDAPSAADDTGSTTEETPVTIDVLANDSDVEGDTLSVAIDTQPTNGAVVVNGDETITYTPNADFAGEDRFTYTASDATDSDTATVRISVSPVNDAPVASDDSATTDEDQSVTVNVLANDSDVDGDTLSVVATTAPADGTVSDNGDGTIRYRSNADFNGSDSFTYDVSDGTVSVTATVTITINPVNDAPVATPDSGSVVEDSSVDIDVITNDTDVDADALSVASIDLAPAHGVATDNADGTINYAPDANFNGSDFFIYTVTDSAGGFDSTYVEVTVSAENDAPVANAGPDQTVSQNDLVQLDGSATDDVDAADTLTYQWTVTNEPSGQAITLSDSSVVSPSFDATKTGSYEFLLTVDDGTTTSTDSVIITAQ
jgi:uncharacterized protein YjdB